MNKKSIRHRWRRCDQNWIYSKTDGSAPAGIRTRFRDQRRTSCRRRVRGRLHRTCGTFDRLDGAAVARSSPRRSSQAAFASASLRRRPRTSHEAPEINGPVARVRPSGSHRLRVSRADAGTPGYRCRDRRPDHTAARHSVADIAGGKPARPSNFNPFYLTASNLSDLSSNQSLFVDRRGLCTVVSRSHVLLAQLGSYCLPD